MSIFYSKPCCSRIKSAHFTDPTENVYGKRNYATYNIDILFIADLQQKNAAVVRSVDWRRIDIINF